MVLKGHTGAVTSLAWSPDGQTLATGSLDGTVRLWQRSGKLERVLEGHAGRVFAVAWSPDGKTLATGAIENFLNPTVQLWNLDGKIITSLSTSFSGGKFYNLAWSPDGQFLLGGATDYKLWRANGEQVFWLESSQYATPSWGMAWSPDSRRWAVGNESGSIEVYDTTGKLLASMQDQAGINSLAWTPDGHWLASSKTIWQADGRPAHTLVHQPEEVYSLAWSPDGHWLASGGSDSVVHLWNGEGQYVRDLSGAGDALRAVAWSPDGRTIAAGSNDQKIYVWSVR